MSEEFLAHTMQLSPVERIRLAQDIWQTVEDYPDEAVLSTEQIAELDLRLKRLADDGSQGEPWRDVLKDIRSKQ